MPGTTNRRMYHPENLIHNLFVRVIFSILIISFFFPLNAENTPIAFAHISPGEKLSQSAVNCILQDGKGFMWFGTEDGLYKYDGYRITVYRPEPGNPSSISNNHFNCMLIDRTGNFWIGTQYGLNTFNFETETFTHFLHDSENPEKKHLHPTHPTA